MSWFRERRLDVQEVWLVYSGKAIRSLRRLSLRALREKTIELNERPVRRQAAQMHLLREDFREHPEQYPFFSAPTQPLQQSRQPSEE